MDYTERELNFLLTNYQKFGLRVISDKLGRSLTALETKMKRLGIKASRKCNATKEELENLQFEREDGFKINFQTHRYPKHLAYWLGYFWADGYIDSKNGLRIECVTKDLQNVEHIFDKVAKFHKYHRIRPNRQPQSQFYICDKVASNLLRSLGKYTKSSESHQKIIEFIPEQYRNYFIRGFIDGDGCYYHVKKSKTIVFSICGNYSQDWIYIQKYFLDNFQLKTRVIQRTNEENKHSELISYSINDLKRFVNYIYADNDGIWLQRKYDKIKHLLDTKTEEFILLSPEN